MTDTTVLHRHPKTRNFTQIENTTIRDSGISYRATGLLVYLLSLPHGSPIDSKTLAQRKTEGRDAIRTAYTELLETGYVHRTKMQRANDGRWVTVIHVYEVPRPDFQASGTQASDFQASDFQALSTNEGKTERQERICVTCGEVIGAQETYSDHEEVCGFTPVADLKVVS